MHMLSIREVEDRTSYSRKTIYRKIAKGDFPKQRLMGCRHVAWVESEVTAWIEKQASVEYTPRTEPLKKSEK